MVGGGCAVAVAVVAVAAVAAGVAVVVTAAAAAIKSPLLVFYQTEFRALNRLWEKSPKI